MTLTEKERLRNELEICYVIIREQQQEIQQLKRELELEKEKEYKTAVSYWGNAIYPERNQV